MRTSLIIFLLLSLGPIARAQEQASAGTDCSMCHDQAGKIAGTAHASVGCVTCHPKHEEFPHPAGIPKPACAGCHAEEATRERLGVHGRARAQGNTAAPECNVCHGDVHEVKVAGTEAFRKSIPETCGMCHDKIFAQFRQSVHGQAAAEGIVAAPICTSCHGEHEIQPPASATSPVHSSHIPETCGRCHADVRLTQRFNLPSESVVSFRESFHGLALSAGRQTVANCASCHGVHNILPSSDPRSTINAANLPRTCGKCHAGAGSRFVIGRVHWVEGQSEPAPVRWVRLAYELLIPLLIGLMFMHQFADWARKVFRSTLRPASDTIPASRMTGAARAVARHPASFRMYAVERVLHGLLALSFVVLVWTGFALKYSDQLWAKPLIDWETISGWPVRGVIHRIAGVVLIAVSFVHALLLVASPRLRRHWKTMLPRRNDVWEGIANFAYLLGIRGSRPRVSFHSYIEKAEYWAVIWGTAVMAFTGILLWANTFVLRWLPKLVLDISTSVHFYEALLATLAIVVWHFYMVIFDPEVYPTDPAWLTGYSIRKRELGEDHEDKLKSGNDSSSGELR